MLLQRGALLLGLLFVASVDARSEQITCEYPDDRLHAASMHRECLAEHFPEFIDYFLNYPSCTLVISVTGIEDAADLETRIRPSFAGFGQGIPSPPCPAEGEVNVVFRQLDTYSYAEISEWAKQVEPLVRDVEPDWIANVHIMDGRFRIFVQTDAAMSRVVEIIGGLDIPRDAYEVGSRETEIREMPSIAPDVRADGDRQQVVLPVYLWSKEKAADLVLGTTVLADAEAVLPAWPGHGPYRQTEPTPREQRSPWIGDEANDAIDKVRVNYNPQMTFVALAFDDRERLVLVQYEVQEGQGSSLLQGLRSLAPLEEIHREGATSVSRARISPCVLADVGMSPGSDDDLRVAVVTYIYTCKLP